CPGVTWPVSGFSMADTGQVHPAHGLLRGFYAPEHGTLDTGRSVLDNMRTAAPHLVDAEQRRILGSFLFSGDAVDKPAGVLSGGEKTRLPRPLPGVAGAHGAAAGEP